MNENIFKKSFAATVVSAALMALTACGGGGGGGDTSPSAQDNASNTNGGTNGNGGNVAEQCFTGTPSAAFTPDATARVGYYGFYGSGSTSLGSITVDANKAVVGFDTTTLTGNHCVKDMQGDSSYTMGRWRNGVAATVNYKGETLTSDLSKAVNSSFLYYAFKRPVAPFIQANTTQIACTNLSSTQAAWNKGTSTSTYFISPTLSNSQITLDSTGNVKIDFMVTAPASGNVITQGYSTTARWLGTAYNSYTPLGYTGVGGQSNQIGEAFVGAGVGNNINIGGYYVLTDKSGSQYTAAFSMTCPVTP